MDQVSLALFQATSFTMVYMHVHVYNIHIHISSVYTYTHTQRECAFVCVYVFMNLCMHVCMCICVFVSIYSIHRFMFSICVYTHIYTQPHTQPPHPAYVACRSEPANVQAPSAKLQGNSQPPSHLHSQCRSGTRALYTMQPWQNPLFCRFLHFLQECMYEGFLELAKKSLLYEPTFDQPLFGAQRPHKQKDPTSWFKGARQGIHGF